MNLRFFGHWLAFLWAVTKRSELSEAVRKAKSAGATGFELIYHVLNKLGPQKTAEALRTGGMSKAIMCIFFPPGQDGAAPPMGDPLGEGKSFDAAVETFRRVLRFMTALRGYGIDIGEVAGPSCWVLGKKYEHLTWPQKKERILKFFAALGGDLGPFKVAIELLRSGEDFVVETVEHWIELIDALNEAHGTKCFYAHYDTFHINERGIDQATAIQQLGRRILHLHLNGTGRRPAGGEGDTLDWAAIMAALQENVMDGRSATNEPFCDLVRGHSPELGDGLPPAVQEPGGMITTRETLEQNGVRIIA